MNPFLLKKVLQKKLARPGQGAEIAGTEVGDKWSGRAQPVTRVAAASIWTDPGMQCNKQDAEIAKILRDAQVWRNPEALEVLPELLRDGLLDAAREVIQWKIRLKCILKIAKARRGICSLKIHDKPSESLLCESPLFKHWPARHLAAIIQACSVRAWDAGEHLFHAGEPRNSGVIILLAGSVRELQRRDGISGKWTVTGARTASSNPKGLCFYGDLEQLTEEPHPSGVVTITPCESWVVPHSAIVSAFDDLSPEVRAAVYDTVFEAKSLLLPTQLPVTPDILRGASPIFREGTNAELEAVVSKLVPSIVQRGREIFTQGASPSSCYILRSGTVRLVARSSLVDGTTDLSSRTIGTVTALCEVDMMFKERLRATAVAETHCYLYVLHYNDFLSLSAFAAKAAKAATMRRKDVMDRSMVPKCIIRCPLFADLPPDTVARIADLFEPLVHSAGELIASTSKEVETVILIAGGYAKVLDIDTARFPKEARVHPGECIGYTGLVPQRWSHTIVAATLVESWALPFGRLRRLLREEGIFQAALELSRSILDTSAESGRAVQRFRSPVSPRPPCHGSSDTDMAVEASRVGQGLWRRTPLSARAVRIAKAKPQPLPNSSAPISPRKDVGAGKAGREKSGGAAASQTHPHEKHGTACVALRQLCSDFDEGNRQLRAMCEADLRGIRATAKSRDGISVTRSILPNRLAAKARRSAREAACSGGGLGAAQAHPTVQSNSGGARLQRQPSSEPVPQQGLAGRSPQHSRAVTPELPGSQCPLDGGRDMRCDAARAPHTHRGGGGGGGGAQRIPRPPRHSARRPQTARPTGLDDLCHVDEATWRIFDQWSANRPPPMPIPPESVSPSVASPLPPA